jgi:hypothetical protein
MASTLAGTTTPSVGPLAAALPARLLATTVVAPTEEEGFSVIHGQALIDLLTPYIAATYGTPVPTPVSELPYPASLDKGSLAAGLAALQQQEATSGDTAPVMAGISQGAVVISLYKQAFNEQYAGADPATIPKPTFVLVGNPSRPNGGLSERLASFGVAALGGTETETIPTPTETAGAAPGEITTYDYARQYDLFADFPNRPLNAFAITNAIFGAILAHGSYGPTDPSIGIVGQIMSHNPYGTVGPEDAVLQDTVGDTQYYMIPSPVLPMLQPLAFIGVPKPIIAMLDAPLRVLVEAGYDRTISPGTPTGIQLLPIADPIRTAINFAIAIPTGIDDGLQMAGFGRPLHTTVAGPYGVGGPPVTLPAADAAASTKVVSTAAATSGEAEDKTAQVDSNTASTAPSSQTGASGRDGVSSNSVATSAKSVTTANRRAAGSASTTRSAGTDGAAGSKSSHRSGSKAGSARHSGTGGSGE